MYFVNADRMLDTWRNAIDEHGREYAGSSRGPDVMGILDNDHVINEASLWPRRENFAGILRAGNGLGQGAVGAGKSKTQLSVNECDLLQACTMNRGLLSKNCSYTLQKGEAAFIRQLP